VLPKLLNESIAIRGVMSNSRALSAAMMAISASSSADGSMLTVGSAMKYVRPSWIIRYSPATRVVSRAGPMTCRAGRMTSG
jgi:hypothetical protein